MRIGVFDPYLDDIGGGEKYMMTIASLLSRGHEVDVFWDNTEDFMLVSKRFAIDVSKVRLVKNVFRPDIGFVQRFIQTLSYDAIIFLSDGSIPLVGARRLYIHIQQPLERMQRGFSNNLKLSRVTKFFCNSRYTQRFISEKFGIPTEILYPPVAISEKILREAQHKENIILHVGRFRVKNVSNGDYKKQSVMIEAFKQMVDKGLKNWKFVLAISFFEKEQKEFEEMQKKTKRYPIEFLINQTNNDLWDVYSKAKIYWHASGYGEDLQKHPEFAEHFGISTVEAMGAGAVPVVINAGGQKEIVIQGKNGFLWDNLDELSTCTKKLIEDENLLKKLSHNAQKTALKFSDKTFAEKIDSLIS